MKCLQEPRTWTDAPVRSKQRKRDMRFGTWNIRNLLDSSPWSKQISCLREEH